MRSRKVSPGLEVMRISDFIREDLRSTGHGTSVASRFANNGSAFAGDHRFVDGGDTIDDFAVTRDEVTGLPQ